MINMIKGMRPLDVGDIVDKEYDAVLATLGYEERASYAAVTLRPRSRLRTACAFAERQSGFFANNANLFRDQGYAIDEVSEQSIPEWCEAWLSRIVQDSDPNQELRVQVDISCMSRTRMASVLAALMQFVDTRDIVADFVYSTSTYSPPSDLGDPIVAAGAVLPFFAGWSNETDQPLVAIIGLGYEPDKAVGAFEYIEASDVWAFSPSSPFEPRFDAAVKKANKSLLERIPASQRLHYRLDEPVMCFGRLESLVYGLSKQNRPVIIPFGPKLFSLCALLVACVHRDTPVWRISSDQIGQPVDRAPSGRIIALRAVIGPSSDAGVEVHSAASATTET